MAKTMFEKINKQHFVSLNIYGLKYMKYRLQMMSTINKTPAFGWLFIKMSAFGWLFIIAHYTVLTSPKKDETAVYG